MPTSVARSGDDRQLERSSLHLGRLAVDLDVEAAEARLTSSVSSRLAVDERRHRSAVDHERRHDEAFALGTSSGPPAAIE